MTVAARITQADMDRMAKAVARAGLRGRIIADFANRRLEFIIGESEQAARCLGDAAAAITTLQAELERRDRNETRNCINWGPCSWHDGVMTEPKS